MHKDILLVPTFIAFVGLSFIGAIRARLDGDNKTAYLFGGASILFVVITVIVWRHMDLTLESFKHIF